MRTRTKMLHLHVGDQIRVASKQTIANVPRYARELRPLGYTFRYGPTPSGYMVTCVASPHSPANKTRH